MICKKFTKNIIFKEESYTDKIIKENYERIYKYCYFHLNNFYTAQDLVQEVFLKFLSNIEQYDECGQAINYLYVIARNLINDYSRKPCEILMHELSNEKNTEKDMEAVETKIMLFDAIKKLEEQEIEVIILRYYQDLKYKDIAIIMDLPASTVRYKLKQAERKIKKELEKQNVMEKKVEKNDKRTLRATL